MVGPGGAGKAQSGRFILDPFACALSESAPPFGRIAPPGASTIHDLPSTLRSNRRSGSDVALAVMSRGGTRMTVEPSRLLLG